MSIDTVNLHSSSTVTIGIQIDPSASTTTDQNTVVVGNVVKVVQHHFTILVDQTLSRQVTLLIRFSAMAQELQARCMLRTLPISTRLGSLFTASR